jgi:hypothetical protein
MSKRDKNFPDNIDRAAARSPTAEHIDLSQQMRMAESQGSKTDARSEQSRLFNAWLDRTLPVLQQCLGNGTTTAVTSSGSKPKH